MKKGEKIKLYFKLNNRFFVLFNVIQMGKDGAVDLKITDYFTHVSLLSKEIDPNKGFLTEKEFDSCKFVRRAEISYHKDGSFLHKMMDNTNPDYLNPYGQGERWTATDSIIDFQPIMNIEIRRISIYNKSFLQPITKTKEKTYICENDDLFEKNGSYLLILYIRKKTLPLARYTNPQIYSDIVTELNEDLDLCLFIQRYQYPPPQPYYSKRLKGIVTPYLVNTISFCHKESSKNEIKDKFKKNIFNPIFSYFIAELAEGQLINLSEDKLKLIDEVDILYTGSAGKMPVSKPIFIKLVLNHLDNRLTEFNQSPPSIKQDLLNQWIKELQLKIQSDKKTKSI